MSAAITALAMLALVVSLLALPVLAALRAWKRRINMQQERLQILILDAGRAIDSLRGHQALSQEAIRRLADRMAAAEEAIAAGPPNAATVRGILPRKES